jgi:CHAT domain-containing protein
MGQSKVALMLSTSLYEDKQNEAAISILNKITPYFLENEDSVSVAQAYFQLGNCYIAQENYTKALFFSEQKALPILQKLQNGIVRGKCYHNISIGYFYKGDYKNALKYNQQTLQSYLPDFKENDIAKNPTEQQLKPCTVKSDLINVLKQKAEALSKLATQTKSTVYLENSWQTYQVLEDLFGSIREDILTENSKFDLAEKQGWIKDALTIAKKLAAQKSDSSYIEQAYAMVVQNAKAQVINEHFQGEKGKKMANVSAEDLKQERNLVATVAQWHKQQLDNPDDNVIREKALGAEQHFYDFRQSLEKKYPLYYQSKYNHKALEIKEIQAAIKNNMAVIDYLPAGDSLHIFCINKQRLTWKTIAINDIDKSNADSLQALRNQDSSQVKSPKSKQFLTLSNQLYQRLVLPISSELLGIKRLRVIRSGWVNRVAFESLCTVPYEGNWAEKKVPYLIRNCAISYLFSVKELKKERKEKKRSVSVGSFGISYEDDKNFSRLRSADNCLSKLSHTRGGGKLPHATTEATDVKALWGLGDCLLDGKATKKNFINNCQSNNYSIFHLAMHGVAECDSPEKIQLIFSKDKDNEDNLMHLYEIAGMKMNSDLAVLSACHSGDGHLENYEGVLSLGRAFKMAGCRSLITSNSYVIDYTSPIVFEYFYKNLKENDLEKDVALQTAICSYLDDENDAMRIPYRWSNFHLWGDVDKIQGTSSSPIPIWIWAIAGLGAAALLFYYFKKFKRKG